MTIQKSRVIAEIGANHMGDMGLAKAMTLAAAESGCDTVKFQSWRASKLIGEFPDYDATFARHTKGELSEQDHADLIAYCKEVGVKFLTTCFDLDRIDFLVSLGLDEIKVASPDCGSIGMLEKLMKAFPKLIISTGMTEEVDVLKAIEVTQGHDVVFLHCVSLYPTPLESVNMARMDRLREQGKDMRVGFSDHSLGTEAACLAISRGAEIIEKHFTLSRSLPGKDQTISGVPAEFKIVTDWAEMHARMMGVTRPPLSETEQKLAGIFVGKWGDNG